MMLFIPESCQMFPYPVLATIDSIDLENQEIRVAYHDTTWFGRLLTPCDLKTLKSGQNVHVYGIEGISLLITIY